MSVVLVAFWASAVVSISSEATAWRSTMARRFVLRSIFMLSLLAGMQAPGCCAYFHQAAIVRNNRYCTYFYYFGDTVAVSAGQTAFCHFPAPDGPLDTASRNWVTVSPPFA